MSYRLYQASNEWDADQIQNLTSTFQYESPGRVLTVLDNGNAPENSIILKFTDPKLAEDFETAIAKMVGLDIIDDPITEEIFDPSSHFALK